MNIIGGKSSWLDQLLKYNPTSITATNLGTSSQGFLQGPYQPPSLVVSSNGLDVCCSQWESTYRRFGDSREDSHDERGCGLNTQRLEVNKMKYRAAIERVRLTIFHAVFEHKLGTFLAGFPPWRDVASRWLPTKFGKILVGFVENGMLLLETHGLRVLVRVAMEPSRKRLFQRERQLNGGSSHTSHARHLLS